ncbi:MAG: hypothetical protein APU95_04045 [Hadesarchaea archaeon YNP_N21]|nr:MAG: hypothetical protein APU95_04045 [Hadesarchaea archaeon YNP_N21]
MEEKDVKKMAELLLAGGKMLSQHCQICKSPLFEFKGKIICPIHGEKTKAEPETKKLELPHAEIEHILSEKLASLAEELRGENKKDEMNRILNLMKSILDLLEKLKTGQ